MNQQVDTENRIGPPYTSHNSEYQYHQPPCTVCISSKDLTDTEFIDHLRTHVELPDVTCQKLSDRYIARCISRKNKVAKKRTHRSPEKSPNGRLCLTLKLDTTTSRFEVVAPRLPETTGPDGARDGSQIEPTNVEQDPVGAVAAETLSTGGGDSAFGSVADSDSAPESGPALDPASSEVDAQDNAHEDAGFESAAGEDDDDDRLGDHGGDFEDDGSGPEEEEEEDEEEVDEEPEEGEEEIDIKVHPLSLDDSEAPGAKLLEEFCRETTDQLSRQGNDSCGSADYAPPSPTPSEQLRPSGLLAPTPLPPGLQPATMVQENGTSGHSSSSPGFPSVSPAAPSEEHAASDKPPDFQFHFQSAETDANVTSPSEEHDPLQLTDPLVGESLLRGFLASPTKEAASVPLGTESHLNHLMSSEYMPLDRLGENRPTALCDVCGERAADRAALDIHKAQAGHFKCNRLECCNKTYTSADELTTHLRMPLEGSFSPRQPVISINQSLQSPPVQQLQQQVQRMPMGSNIYLSQSLQAPLVQIPNNSSAILQQMMQPQVRPPPLYRLPPPTGMPAQAFANVQIMSQLYVQQGQFRSPQPTFQQQQQQQLQQQQQQQQQLQQQLQHQQQANNFQQQQQQQQQQRPQYNPMMQQQQQLQRPQQQQRMMHPGNQQRPQMPMTPQQRAQQMQHQQQQSQMRAKRMAQAPLTPPGPPKRRMDDVLRGRSPAQPSPQKRPTESIHVADPISLMRQPGGAVTVTPVSKKSEASAVASVLAARGITVIAAGNSQRQGPRPAPPEVTSLKLNSAISLTPTNSGSSNSNSSFAVPQNRGRPPQTNTIDRPPRPPTVDLTGDNLLNQRGPGGLPMYKPGRRGRPPGSRLTCQMCDKAFTTEDALMQHMQLHRSPGKLPYRCSICPAQYPTAQGLLQHRQQFHKEISGPEMAIPVVNLKDPGVMTRLANLGIAHFVPLSQLSNSQGGIFGLPIVSTDSARDPAVCNLGMLGASNILSLGPIKQLNRN